MSRLLTDMRRTLWNGLRAHLFVARNPILSFQAAFLYLLTATGVVGAVNLSFIKEVLGSQLFEASEVLFLFGTLYRDLFIENGYWSGTLVALLILFFSTEIVLLLLYARTLRELVSRSLVELNFISLTASLIGLGCVACGSLLSILPVAVSFSSALVFLPFEGKEFSIVGAVLLFTSIGLLYTRILQLQR